MHTYTNKHSDMSSYTNAYKKSSSHQESRTQLQPLAGAHQRNLLFAINDHTAGGSLLASNGEVPKFGGFRMVNSMTSWLTMTLHQLVS